MTTPACDFDGTRARWLAGLCLCCAGDICEWEWHDTVYEPEPIAEGVMMCGRCVGNQHNEPPEFVSLLLEALLP